MFKLRAYLEPIDKRRLIDLAYQQGYVKQRGTTHGTVPVLHYSHGLALFLSDLFATPLQTSPTLYQGKPPHSSTNLVTLTLPLTLSTMPNYFSLQNWDQLLTNIAREQIAPTVSYPSTPVVQDTARVVLPYALPYAITTTTFTHNLLREAQRDKNMTNELLPPDQYRDNRPQPPDEITIGPSARLPFTYWWYLPDMPRETKTVYLDPEQIDKLLAIREHWHILPLRHRTQQAMLAITLEALCHKLLVPTTPLDV